MIKPALSAEEWVTLSSDHAKVIDDRLELECFDGHCEVDNRHGIAALALHGQVFGFTWEDVDGIRSIARNYECEHDASRELAHYEAMNWANSLADRIEALLPPRESGQ